MTASVSRRRKRTRRIVSAGVVVVLVCSLAVAAGSPLRRQPPDPAAAARASAAAEKKTADYFFGGKPENYGFPLDLKMRRKLLVLRAHRRLNPCGLVDPVKLVAADPGFQQYGVDSDLSVCSLEFLGDEPSVVALKISQNPPTMRLLETFSVGPITVRRHAPAEPGTCLYVFNLGISDLPGAPERLADFQAQITAPEDSSEGACARGRAVAVAAAARLAAKGAPKWLPSDPLARVGEADPCLPARRVHGMAGFSDTDVGTHWCAFLYRPAAARPDPKTAPAVVKLNVQLRPAAFANQQGDSWNITESQTTQRGDKLLLVYSGAFDPATGSYRPPSDKAHCSVYLMAKERLVPRAVDATELDESQTRLPTVEVRGDQAPCSVNRDIATAWASQLG
ncbi:hypothetical protein Srot_2944 [Segniliparus rotundus DSM 44985]|uniref:Uncharacterized protein n=1 Tax=Segniliparus rotundus (strain ATCC BAA-972 / CDC 1076 / CIP 108378 / DSM 44985 / JCM 13578) TaxID=640132 RepID=D6ZDW6_SEGRD|nr:hypothetical protein [Segniliparus rotundus]ADG99373.1 hypothetical protein Srot_2944 [Segniliparus rotundus DSM 44985]